jgi:EamA domain-containing membrane protein RarD
MKAFLKEQEAKKFYSCIIGILFALLSIPFFVWGVKIIITNTHCYDIVYPFIGMVLCLFFGFYFMFRKKKMTEKEQLN